ncbi:aminotransferase class V-fold PLP-dependent enzyme [Acetobacter thailandicus]|uniref:aminotransferase class V-fold PLP-dependent enzyme n=1 Tax=Acetobacter thailandicus TaxID=1502842 RepID=UPI001BA70537|nr:aminotransferase class V-fold PLP-dependent enzyme [Acetobacter thailandicus]
MTNFIYIDNFSTTPLSPYALSQMTGALSLTGNPASPHIAGAQALFRINEAREKIADFIGALSSEILFTSGATEANNLGSGPVKI